MQRLLPSNHHRIWRGAKHLTNRLFQLRLRRREVSQLGVPTLPAIDICQHDKRATWIAANLQGAEDPLVGLVC